MIELSVLATYVLACTAIILVPGPTVTVIIANSLRSGSRAGMMNIAGTQLSMFIMIGILALGLHTIVNFMGEVFVYLKLVGAAYLIWLGIGLWRSNGDLADPNNMKVKKKSLRGYFWQGFFVALSNPKILLFFGAFIPQFVNPDGNLTQQTLLLGVIFMVIATFFDGLYALAAGRAGGLLSRSNIRIVERVSGSLIIGGGLWLALARRN